MKKWFGLLLCFSLAAQDFTIKKKKEPSINMLKEECCQLQGDFLRLVPDILSSIAQVQSKAINAIQGYFESDKQSLCEIMTKEQLIAANKKGEEILKKIEELTLSLSDYTNFLSTIKK